MKFQFLTTNWGAIEAYRVRTILRDLVSGV